jgi:ABC-type uncharacterized transport system
MKQILAAAIALLSLSACAPLPQRKGSEELHVLTSLPLFWGEGDVGDILGNRSGKARILSALETQRRVIPLETAERASLASVRILMIAQPRRLAPAELVELDVWLRNGGRLLVFTDPLLDWPSELPLGDVRRAPPVGLLDPLLAHWGLELGDADMAAPSIQFGEIGQQRVVTAHAGTWSEAGHRCKVESALLAVCHVRHGVAFLVADVDLLNAALWGAEGTDNESAILGLVSRVASEKRY